MAYIVCDKSKVFHLAHQEDMFGYYRSYCNAVRFAVDTPTGVYKSGRKLPQATKAPPRGRRVCDWCIYVMGPVGPEGIVAG